MRGEKALDGLIEVLGNGIALDFTVQVVEYPRSCLVLPERPSATDFSALTIALKERNVNLSVEEHVPPGREEILEDAVVVTWPVEKGYRNKYHLLTARVPFPGKKNDVRFTLVKVDRTGDEESHETTVQDATYQQIVEGAYLDDRRILTAISKKACMIADDQSWRGQLMKVAARFNGGK